MRFKKTTLKSFGGIGEGSFDKRKGGLPKGSTPKRYTWNPETGKFEDPQSMSSYTPGFAPLIVNLKHKNPPKGWVNKRKAVEKRLDEKRLRYKPGQKDFYSIEK